MTKSCFWAAICVGFFGFLQSGEFTATPTYCSDHVISVSDISVDSRSNPQVVTFTLRYSKTDQAGKSSCIYLGRTGDMLCPVTVLRHIWPCALSHIAHYLFLKVGHHYHNSNSLGEWGADAPFGTG